MLNNELLQNSDEYMFEIKTNNFKIVLSKFIKSLIDIDEENDIESLYNIIVIGEELIKQFDIIHQKFLSFQDKKSPTKIKNLESKIEIMKNNLIESDKTINELEIKYENEKNSNTQLEKEIHETKSKLEESKKVLGELEESLIKQKEEFVILHNKKQEENNNLSMSYINKLSDANEKLLKQKNDKIKQLESDLDKNYNSLDEHVNTNRELILRIDKLERENIDLNTKINTKLNEQTKTISLDEELTISKQKEEIISLNNKIKELVNENNLLKINKVTTDLNKPLLKNEDKNTMTYFKNMEDTRHTCSFCCMM